MNAVDYIVLGVVVLILALAAFYVIRAKKSGKKCIGCPVKCSENCSGCCSACSGCSKNS